MVACVAVLEPDALRLRSAEHTEAPLLRFASMLRMDGVPNRHGLAPTMRE